MEVASVTGVAQKFAAAVVSHDEAAARGCARMWQGDRDGPARLYRQLVDQAAGLAVVGEPQQGTDGRAAQPVAITQGGKQVAQLTLIGEGEPFLWTGVATNDLRVARFLAGEAPAVVAFDELPADPAARAAVEALARSLAGASDEHSEALGAAMSSGAGAVVVVGYLAHAASQGAKLEVIDARGLPRLGRAVVSVNLVVDGGDPETIFVYLDHDADPAAPVRWLAWTPYFSGDTLLAR